MSSKVDWRRSIDNLENSSSACETTEFEYQRSISFSKSMALQEQRFSLGDLFYKDRRKSRQEIDEDEESSKFMNVHRGSTISMDEDYVDEQQNYSLEASQTDGSQKMLSMKDQEQMLQELKKENFDLKLRLYMTEKNSETAEGKVSEYEHQLAALVQSLEEQQQLSDLQAKELQQALDREKALKGKQKKLETTCREQDEKIHNLSLSLNQLSTSMHDLSVPKHSTPARGTQSAYFLHDEREINYDDDDVIRNEPDIKPFNNNQSNISHVAPNVSHVAPMRRELPQDSTNSFNDESNASLLQNDRGVHTSVSETHHFNTTAPVHKNYYNSTSADNRVNRTEGGGYDNIGVVRPNNTRTVVDVELPEGEARVEKKKKKKGILNVFKLCAGGKSNDPRASVYQKREPAKITMTTYND